MERLRPPYEAVRTISRRFNYRQLRARIRGLQHERWTRSDDSKTCSWKLWTRDFWADTITPAAQAVAVPFLTEILHHETAFLFTARASEAMKYGVELVDTNGKSKIVFDAWAFASHVENLCQPVLQSWRDFASTVTAFSTAVLLRKMCQDVLSEAPKACKLPHLLEPITSSGLESATTSRVVLACLQVAKPVAQAHLDPLHLPMDADQMEFVRQGARVFVLVQRSPSALTSLHKTAILTWLMIARGALRSSYRKAVLDTLE